ncbi:MAG: ABC transporter ATP-binding protein [Desulfobacterales bacterium]|jgi:branched-chain amino acid transport system ATP-binding protein
MKQMAIELVGITKIFGGLRALDNISLRVPVGERRALIGPNGAGKTTLFNCIAGSLAPSSGQNLLFGRDVTFLPEYKRIAMGLGRTYQITNVFHRLTVLENVLLAVQGTQRQKWIFHRTVGSFRSSQTKAMEQLTRIGLDHRHNLPVHQLSYGEQKQLEFALALASDPKVLLLDEPASGLAPAERQRILDLISDLPKDITVILIEHDVDMAMGMADQVAVLHQGRLIVDDKPEAVRRNSEVREVYFGNI